MFFFLFVWGRGGGGGEQFVFFFVCLGAGGGGGLSWHVFAWIRGGRAAFLFLAEPLGPRRVQCSKGEGSVC